MKTRYYDPETGRFISPDSPKYLAPEILNGLNLYAYCGNNPVMNGVYNGFNLDKKTKTRDVWAISTKDGKFKVGVEGGLLGFSISIDFKEVYGLLFGD